MKVRRSVKEKANLGPRIEVVPVESAGMVTLDSPEAPLDGVKDAFVRLRPTENLTPEQTRSWANVVRPLARAFRILPARRSALVPGTSSRLDAEAVVGTVRDEVTELVRAENDPELAAIVEQIMSEVERA